MIFPVLTVAIIDVLGPYELGLGACSTVLSSEIRQLHQVGQFIPL